MSMKIRLYGVEHTRGSYRRVTQGVRGALERLGLLAGFRPIDDLDPWAEYDGATADVGLFVGPQVRAVANMMLTTGIHARRMMLLPVNSSHIPESIRDLANRPVPKPVVTEWLTPSQWSMDRIVPFSPVPVTVWRHGVSRSFAPMAGDYDVLVNAYNHGVFRLLHLASTVRQRKGTVPLIQAWTKAMKTGRLPNGAMLVMVVSGGDTEMIRSLAADAGGSVGVLDESDPRIGGVDASFLRQYHGVVQPSRGEGFGMVPLEALCCGLPVVATVCSGHSEYMDERTPGVAVIAHGPDARIDDGPGAVAPSVSVEAIESALISGYEGWKLLAEEAMDNAEHMRTKWSWDAVMRTWAEQEGWL